MILARVYTNTVNVKYTCMQDVDPNQESLIYADIITSPGSSGNQFSIFLDDDRVEYAKIEQKAKGDPISATKMLPERSAKIQSTKG